MPELNSRKEDVKMYSIYFNNFFKFLKNNDSYFEVRILKTESGTVSGYFNDGEMLLKAVRRYDGRNNIFFTLNSINQDIAVRSINKFTKFAKNTTADKEIIHLDWIMLDFDPKRPAGISSTDEELSKAEQLSDAVEDFLAEQGFPEPVKCMSGNGRHLLYPIDMENTAENVSIVKKFLANMSQKFSNDDVEIDKTTYNPARITKLYGTVACKGDPTKERPHRRSYIISAPDVLECVSAEKLSKIISMFGASAKPDKSDNVRKVVKNNTIKSVVPKIDIREFCETHGIEISHEKPNGDGICYVLKTCPWNPEHTDKGAYIVQFPNGKVVARCHHNSCSNENWKTLLEKYHVKDRGGQPFKSEPLEGIDGLSAAEIIIKGVQQAGHKFYCDENENAYAAVPLENGHTEYMAVRDRRYKQFLRQMYYGNYGKAVHKDSLQQVIDTLEAKAVYESPKLKPAIRCKYEGGKLFYYLADAEQTVLCINAGGIHVLKESPIPFVKMQSMLEQVMPLDRNVKEGEKKPTFRKLARKYWKFKSKDDLMLHNVVLLTRFISDIPSPILYYKGDRGSAKTTCMRLDKLLVDPAAADVKALPNSINDIVSALSGQYMVGFDNLEGGISAEVSNLLCICCSSGYYSKRKLFTDNESVNIKLNIRLSLSGITTITERADLLDRCVYLSSQRIPDKERKTEREVMDEFKADLPYLLYRALKILTKAIPIYESLKLQELPRMADFAKWGYAIAEVMKYGGNNFLEAYKRNQEEILEEMVEEDSVLNVLVEWIGKNQSFDGTMSELHVVLTKHAEKMGINTHNGWIKGLSALSRKILRSQSVLSLFGIYIDRGKSNGIRYIKIWKEDEIKNE